MSKNFKVQISDFDTIDALPNAWTLQQYKELLGALDYGDTSQIPEVELKDMTYMAVADLETNEAATTVLSYLLSEHLNEGQIENLSHEMLSEKMWEEYAEIHLHEAFFNAGSLLYKSYNGKFPHPEAVQFTVNITASNSDDLSIFDQTPEIPLLRLLVNAMPQNTLLNRLYKTQLEGEEPFEEAVNIVWQLKKGATTETSLTYEVISSLYWLHDLKFVDAFEGVTSNDEVAEEDEN